MRAKSQTEEICLLFYPQGCTYTPYTPFRYPYVNFIDLIKVSVEMLNV